MTDCCFRRPWQGLQGALLLPLALPLMALAQQAPDAGQLLQQQSRQPVQPTPQPGFQVPTLPPDAPVAAGGPQVLVQQVQWEGNHALTANRLSECLGPQALGQRYDLAGLHGLAQRATDCYRAAGHLFAKVYLPRQDMRDGQLRLQVLEGRYGSIQVRGNAMAQQALGFTQALRSGDPILAEPLTRAMLLISDQPGWTLQPVMQPGQAEGAGDLLLELQPRSRWSGSIGGDNHGNRYSGAHRAQLALQVNSLLAFGDQLAWRSFGSDEGMLFGSLNYSRPLGGQGLRGSLNLASTRYTLGGPFANANAWGRAHTASLGLAYPLLRSAEANLNLGLQYQHKRLRDVSGQSLDSRKSADALPLSLNFDRSDAWLGGGVTFGGLMLTRGRLNLDAGAAATDAASARTAGGYTTLGLELARQQALGAHHSALLQLSTQSARQNLDSSAKFSLGGASGVRAYPSGEASGDRGWLLRAELRWHRPPSNPTLAVAPYVFADAGEVTVNARPWASGSGHKRQLSGVGLGLRTGWKQLSADAALAWRVDGGAPQADTRDRQPRLWLSLNHPI